MYLLKYSNQFKKDLKYFRHEPVILNELTILLDLLIKNKELPKKYCKHRLLGEFNDCFECHVRPDVLLIYKIKDQEVIVLLLRIGSHSDLF